MDQALGSTAWGQIFRHLGKIYLLWWAGKFCLLKASKLSPEICSQARPAHKESCSQDWGAVRGSRQQGLEVVPVWGPWGDIFSPFIYLFKFLNILTTLHVHEVFLLPWPGIEPAPPTLAARSPNNWTTGDVPTWERFVPGRVHSAPPRSLGLPRAWGWAATGSWLCWLLWALICAEIRE